MRTFKLREIICLLTQRVRAGRATFLIKVKSHRGEPINERADTLEPRASVPLTHDLELGPVCGEMLRETPLRRDGARRSGLLVLGAGRRRGSNLSPIVCLVEVFQLRKDEGARAGVLGARGRRWWWCACVDRGAAARA